MMKLAAFFFILCAVSCQNEASPTHDFLQGSDSNSMEFRGYFQGVENSDSSGPYISREVYRDSLSYELVFVPKDLDKKAATLEGMEKAKKNNYIDLMIFAFAYPMQDPDKMEDYHADNTPYPVTIKSYVREGANWKLLSTTRANNLTELSREKIRVIYSHLK